MIVGILYMSIWIVIRESSENSWVSKFLSIQIPSEISHLAIPQNIRQDVCAPLYKMVLHNLMLTWPLNELVVLSVLSLHEYLHRQHLLSFAHDIQPESIQKLHNILPTDRSQD